MLVIEYNQDCGVKKKGSASQVAYGNAILLDERSLRVYDIVGARVGMIFGLDVFENGY
jgi:hypothetical protein